MATLQHSVETGADGLQKSPLILLLYSSQRLYPYVEHLHPASFETALFEASHLCKCHWYLHTNTQEIPIKHHIVGSIIDSDVGTGWGIKKGSDPICCFVA